MSIRKEIVISRLHFAILMNYFCLVRIKIFKINFSIYIPINHHLVITYSLVFYPITVQFSVTTRQYYFNDFSIYILNKI